MRKFAIFFLFLCFLTASAKAEEYGRVILDIPNTENESDDYELGWNRQKESLGAAALRTGKDILNMYKYFDETFPGEKLQEDFSEEVASRYPQLNPKEVRDREQNIRLILGWYRNGKKLYEDIKAKFMVPPDPPMIVADQDFDDGTIPDYIETEDGLVITDFKKVISYGDDPKDFKANEARFQKNIKKQPQDEILSQLFNRFSKLKFSKLLDYGYNEPDPFTEEKGMGKWVGSKPVEARIISAYTTFDTDGKILAALQFYVSPGHFLLLEKTKKYEAAEINFDGSKNLKTYDLNWMFPFRIYPEDTQEDFIGYSGNFPVPVTFEVENKDKDLYLKANIHVYVCGETECKPYSLSPELNLSAKETFEDSAVYTYVSLAFNNLAQEKNDKIKFLGAFTENNEFGEPQLRLQYKTSINPAQFSVFIHNKHNILFGRPKTAVRGKIITLYIPVLSPGEMLKGKNITISAGRPNLAIKHVSVIENMSLLDESRHDLSLGILLLAIVGGFLLNLMPCVFPVLSLKVLAITQFGGMRQQELQKGFLLTTCGIYTAFFFITALLCALKALGYSLGWGIQFQNIWFLNIMQLVILLFLAHILGLIHIRTPQITSQIYKIKSESLLSFLTGLFLVLLSTPCTAPYLGTAIGFALSGSYTDIIFIMAAVALGLSLPYLLLFIVPELAATLPTPGSWMNRLQQVMGSMLIITMLWLLSIIAAQTSFGTALRTAFYLLLFLLILWLRRIFLDSTYMNNIDGDNAKNIRKIYNSAAILLSIPLLGFYFYDGHTHFEQHRSEVALTQKLKIDEFYIRQKLKEGKKVLVSVGADWCLTCKFNELTVLNSFLQDSLLSRYNLEVMKVDWTNYNREVLDYMEKFGRKGLPFYVLFAPKIPQGIVLPEILTEKNFHEILNQL